MAEHAVHPSMTHRMDRVRRVFERRAHAKDEDREFYEALEDLATCYEELKASIDYLKIQLDEVRRALGHHLETGGAVPHTRRRG